MFGDITSLFAVSKGLAMRGIRTELLGSAGVGAGATLQVLCCAGNGLPVTQ